MSKASKSNHGGASSAGTTESQLGLQSTNAGNRSTLGTLGKTHAVGSRTGSQAIPNSQIQTVPNAAESAQIVVAFANKLGNMVEWKLLTLHGGRVVWALVFPQDTWKLDETGALIPR